MRTLMIAGIAMVTVIAGTSADAQRITSGGQWHGMAQGGGQVMAPIQTGGQWHGGQMPPPPQGGGQWHGVGQGGGQGQGGQWHGGQWQGGAQQHQSHWGGSIGGHWSGGMNAPGGWRAYRRPSRGWVLPSYWIAPSFFIDDYATYGLSTPPDGYTWSRYYDDAVLMDRNGRVYDSVGGIDWDSYGNGYDAAPVEGGYGAPYPAPPYAGPGPAYAPPPPVQNGYTTTYSSAGAQGGYYRGGYWFPPVTTTTVTVQSAPVVTTTTTEYIEETTSYPVRRVYRTVKRKWHPRPHRSCGCGCCR